MGDPGGGTSPPPPPLSSPPATSPPPPSTTPAEDLLPPPAARRPAPAAVVQPRQLVVIPPSPSRFELQSRLLQDHYATALPDIIAPSSSPAFVWVTPPSRAPCFNKFFVANALRFVLAPGPGRLDVACVAMLVFRFRVSCQNVANVLAVRGSVCIGSVRLFIHHSMAAAELAVERLPSIQCPEPAPNARLYSGVNSVDPREVAPGKVEPALPLDTRIVRLGKVSPDLLTVPALPYTVRATGYSAPCLPPPVVKASGLVAADAAGGKFTP